MRGGVWTALRWRVIVALYGASPGEYSTWGCQLSVSWCTAYGGWRRSRFRRSHHPEPAPPHGVATFWRTAAAAAAVAITRERVSRVESSAVSTRGGGGRGGGRAKMASVLLVYLHSFLNRGRWYIHIHAHATAAQSAASRTRRLLVWSPLPCLDFRDTACVLRLTATHGSAPPSLSTLQPEY